MTPHRTTQNKRAVFSGKLSPADLSPAGHFFEVLPWSLKLLLKHSNTTKQCSGAPRAACFGGSKKTAGAAANPAKRLV